MISSMPPIGKGVHLLHFQRQKWHPSARGWSANVMLDGPAARAFVSHMPHVVAPMPTVRLPVMAALLGTNPANYRS